MLKRIFRIILIILLTTTVFMMLSSEEDISMSTDIPAVQIATAQKVKTIQENAVGVARTEVAERKKEEAAAKKAAQEKAAQKKWKGEVLNTRNGVVQGPSGKETYYNLDMSGVISIMRSQGYDYEYYVREDGVKMFGPYVMCAANLDIRPRGTIIETTLGTAIVCDTGSFSKSDSTQLDIAVSW